MYNETFKKYLILLKALLVMIFMSHDDSVSQQRQMPDEKFISPS